MLSEFSEDLAGMYREGIEADFFRSREEMVEKIRKYLNDDNRRASVAEAGLLRVHSDGQDVSSRMTQVIEWVSIIRSKQLN
jgi:spore maturation protein CgeB